MFEVFSNSIVYPQKIVNYHNKKGGFVFLYILLLVLLMSISVLVFYLSSKPDVITEANSGCSISEGTIVCTGDNYDMNNYYNVYGFPIYILSEEDDYLDVQDRQALAIVLQGQGMNFYVGTQKVSSMNMFNSYEFSNLEEGISVLTTSLIVVDVFIKVIYNALVLLFIILISTIPFIRFKKFISYKKIFKMLTFASTPMAFLFAIYNLLNFDMLIFFILMMVAYRSVFVLQRELHFRIIGHAQYYQQQSQENDFENDVVEEDEEEETKNGEEE
ncbi:MAG: hypothetical protein RBR50_01750 [Candidatus Izemoplasmatales bacterium]|nr:hypothetical protein [Candidatus Izemoplasmatales bacterium]